jgi:multidrug efflux system membrane fusion protein
MRFFSLLMAIVVAAILYVLVFERDSVMALVASPDAETAASAGDSTEAPQDANAARTVSVVALKSSAQQVDSAVLLRGRTEAARQVDVRAEISGLVVSEPLRKGSYVEKDQLLCRIDLGTREAMLAQAQAGLPEAQSRVPEAQGRLAEAEARLEEATINDNAAKQLSQDGFASEIRVAGTRAAVQSALAGVEAAKAGVQAAKAGIQAAEAAVAQARKEIDRLEIRAPFAGLLETDTAELGSLMQPGGLCATVIQLNPIKLVGFVPEASVSKVKLGAQAGGRTTSGEDVLGHVTFVSRSSDMETRTFRVEITVDNDDLALSDGQTAEILISAPGDLAHLLPASALTLDDNGTLGVRLVDGDKAGFSQVRILRDTVDGVWVAGLPQEAAIIVVGQEYITDGVSIAVSYREATQ